MTTLSDSLGKGRTVSINGEKYTFSAITLDDFAEIEKKLIDDRNETLIRKLQAAKMSDTAIGHALNGSLDWRPTQTDNMRFMQTATGILFALYLSLRKAHPDITPEKVAEIIGSDYEQMSELVASITGSESKDDQADPSQETQTGES